MLTILIKKIIMLLNQEWIMAWRLRFRWLPLKVQASQMVKKIKTRLIICGLIRYRMFLMPIVLSI